MSGLRAHTQAMMPTVPIRRAVIVKLLALVLILGLLGLFLLDLELPQEFHELKNAVLGRHKSSSSGKRGPQGLKTHLHPQAFKGIKNPQAHSNFINSRVLLASSFETTIPHNATIHGFNVFDNLVMHNGTFYLVTNNRSSFPEKANIARSPNLPGTWGERDPHEDDFHFITPDELVPLLGDSAIQVQGFSWIMHDVWQFMKHYYHWWGEIILGGWRVYSLLGFDSDGTFHPEWLQSPDRFLIPMVDDGKWRDRPGIIGALMRAAFPQAAIEERDQWRDLIKLNSTFVFDRALITNREAAHAHRYGGRWYKMIAGTQELPAAEFSFESSSSSHEGFWSPIRKSLTLNLLGYLPTFASFTDRRVLSPPSDKSELPVVTYTDRQKTGRRLTEESHKSLVDALLKLKEEKVCEVQIVRMEDVSIREQIRLAARSTIMTGVHGNGLTHQLWMPPSARSTVIEIVMHGGYVFDYEMLARNIGHKHYMVWNDTLLTYPKGTYHKGVNYPDGFHGPNIHVHGPAVARKIKERLLGIEGDDAQEPED